MKQFQEYKDYVQVPSYPDYKSVTKEEWYKACAEIGIKINEAVELWYKDLREKYKHLPDELFNIVYDDAYDRGHSSGYDEVANYMIDIDEFAQRIIKYTKGE